MELDINVVNLTRDELEEELLFLQRKCKQLCEASEIDTQRIHELKRSLETAIAGEKYLSQELEQVTQNTQQKGYQTKLQDEHDELRRKHHELNEEFGALQDQMMALTEENTKLQAMVETLSGEQEKKSHNQTDSCNEQMIERFSSLEQENMELLQKLDEQQADKVQKTMALAEKDKKIELMKDEIACLQENMRFKREEVEEKTRLLESVQEQLYEANSKINMLMSSPNNKDAKGNSLFAEVDDQRQAMKKILAAQKKSYQEMKKIYNESQYELRRLKRENIAIHAEFQACSRIFCNADRKYQEKLKSRIGHLLNEKEDLEGKLKVKDQYIKNLANEKDALWIDSILNFCKKETEELKKQVHSVFIKDGILEEQLRNVQQDMARWRFEALMSRCLVIDRENLLTEKGIAFKPQNELEFDITEDQEKLARPRVVTAEAKALIDTANDSSNEKTTNNQSYLQEKRVDEPSGVVTISLDDTIGCNKENSAPPIDAVTGCSSNEIEPILDIPRTMIERATPTEKEKENYEVKALHEISHQKEKKEEEILKTKPQLQSILSKKRDSLNTNTEKTVKFSTKDCSIIMPKSPEATGEAKEDNIDNSLITVKTDSRTGATIKTVRTKSNVIVRHIEVRSKTK